jgi:lysophospholipase L1-like esterase
MQRGLVCSVTLLGLLLVTSAGRADEQAAATGRQVYAVAAVGDSLTDPRSQGGKYLSYLRSRCPGSRFDNYGRGGENVEQMRRRFSREVLGESRQGSGSKPAYSHVIVFGGVNDILSDRGRGRTPERIKQDIGAMYEMARRAGIRVIGITVSPWEGYTKYYNERRVAATHEVNQWILAQRSEGLIDHALDANTLLACAPGKLCGSYEMPWIRDGLHFNAQAHEKLGKALYETVFADCR